MVDAGFWSAIWSPTTPLAVLAISVIVALFRWHPAYMSRANERVRDRAAIDGDREERDEARIVRLEERVEVLERQLGECLANHAAEHAGRLEAEALLMARQRSDQDSQIRLSAGRQADAAAREEGQ